MRLCQTLVALLMVGFSALPVAAGDQTQPDASRVVLRRLNRIEYENTVRELLGIDIELIDLLPQRGKSKDAAVTCLRCETD